MSDLAERIRDEAAQSARPGQMARLEAIADEVDALLASMLALRAEMVGMSAASASLVGRSWVVHKIDTALQGDVR